MPLSIPSLNRKLHHSPLTQASFAPFGTVIECPSQASQSAGQTRPNPHIVPANQNTALKHINISLLSNHYAQSPTQTPGGAVMNMFSCRPRTLKPPLLPHPSSSSSSSSSSFFDDELPCFSIQILERHPFTTQTFIPMGLSAANPSTKYLVIVAPSLLPPTTPDFPSQGQGLPDLANLRAFLAHGGQALTYGVGTWHAPMAVVGAVPIDFVVVQFCNGVAEEDCEEIEIDGDGMSVAVNL